MFTTLKRKWHVVIASSQMNRNRHTHVFGDTLETAFEVTNQNINCQRGYQFQATN